MPCDEGDEHAGGGTSGCHPVASTYVSRGPGRIDGWVSKRMDFGRSGNSPAASGDAVLQGQLRKLKSLGLTERSSRAREAVSVVMPPKRPGAPAVPACGRSAWPRASVPSSCSRTRPLLPDRSSTPTPTSRFYSPRTGLFYIPTWADTSSVYRKTPGADSVKYAEARYTPARFRRCRCLRSYRDRRTSACRVMGTDRFKPSIRRQGNSAGSSR